MIKDNGAFALEGFTFVLEMSQIDDMSVVLLQNTDELWRSLVSTRLVFHGVNDQDSFWDGVSFVAGEPIWEHRVWCVVSELWEHGDIDGVVKHILDELRMLVLNYLVELGAILVINLFHEFVVSEGLNIGAELGWLNGIYTTSKSDS